MLLWQTLETHRNEKVLVYVDRRSRIAPGLTEARSSLKTRNN